MVLDALEKQETFYIYGAQVVAYGAFLAIRELCGRVPACFLVQSPAGNPQAIEGVPVREAARAGAADALIIVAVTELLQGEAAAGLRRQGARNLFLLTQHEEHLLMARYFAALGKFPLAVPTGEASPGDFALYEVRNHRDKALSRRPPLAPYEHTIQAGAALTGERVADILDSTGASISAKNRQYCEMTATYWVWKNTRHAWKGIEHYRRHLLVRPAMLAADVDAVLPLPYACYPNTLAQFRRFVSAAVLEALQAALRELHPKEYPLYEGILQGRYQYTYNLACARREVFDAYCAWFFRITEYMEGMAEKVPELATTRALSYVAEVLTNLYFMSHQDVWRIRHAEKAIYV